MTTLAHTAPCWAIYAVAVALSWPLWRLASEGALFERRVVLAGVLHDESRLRRWLWHGRIASALHGVAALAWAALALALAALLTTLQWLALAVDAALLVAAIPWAERRLAGEVRWAHVALVSRRWPLAWANAALVALAFFAIDFFGGAPDTRGLPWSSVAERAFERHAGPASCAAAGVVVGSVAAVDALGWHAAQVVVPSLPGVAIRVAAWAAVLFQAGIVGWVFTRLVLGVTALARDRQRGAEAEGDGYRPFAVALLLTTLIVAYLYTTSGGLRRELPAPLRNAAVWSNPCRTVDAGIRWKPVAVEAVEAARREASAAARTAVDRAVAEAFAQTGRRVDDYLDWYFSVLGEYQRLGAGLASGDFGQRMREEFDRRVIESLGLDAALAAASRAVGDASAERMSTAAARLGRTLSDAAGVEPCLADALRWPALPELRRDALRVTGAAMGGVTAAFATRWVAQRVAGVAIARLAGRRSMQAAGAIAGRIAVRRGGTLTLAASAAAACAPGGPLAGVCALVAGAVSWLILDHALVRIDEALLRDQMRADLLEALDEARRRVAEDLTARHLHAIDEAAARLGEAVGRVFVPARDGL